MLKMLFCTNTRTQTFAPLINCIIDNVLSQAMPHMNKMLLQFIQVMNYRRSAATFRLISFSPLG